MQRRVGCKLRGSPSFRKDNFEDKEKSEQPLTWKDKMGENEKKELTVKKKK